MDLHPGDDGETDRRLATLLGVAAAHGTSIPAAELVSLLPERGPTSPDDLARYLERHPELGRLVDGRVVPSRSSAPSLDPSSRRRERGDAYLAQARELPDGPLRSGRRMLVTLAVTGSTAYREPLPGDDLDLMAIVRPGSLWLFLGLSFLRLRFGRGARAPDEAEWCLNYALEAPRAELEFGRSRGALFAREALTASVLLGADQYAAVLARSTWMAEEYPRLFARWAATQPIAADRPTRAALPIRAANVLAFLLLAPYLQAKGLFANARARRAGRPEAQFATITERSRFGLQTRRFRALTSQYAAGAGSSHPEPA